MDILGGGVALVQLARMWSLADSKRRHPNRQPAWANAGQHVAVAQDVLDLDRHVEGQVGEGAVHGVDDPAAA